MSSTTTPGPTPAASVAQPDSLARTRLLDAVIVYVATEGLHDQSLRTIAAAVGSSHRMLLYHFGSKDGLLVAVARAVEARTRAQFAELVVDPLATPDEVIQRMWALVADPELADFERLFFALYGRALQGDSAVRPLLAGATEDWIEANVEAAAAIGVPAETARVHGRLGVAVIRGLLLDLLATGDRAGVDAALAVYAQSYAGGWEGPTGVTDRAS
jgi:AcrR family transcriptional regulator